MIIMNKFWPETVIQTFAQNEVLHLFLLKNFFILILKMYWINFSYRKTPHSGEFNYNSILCYTWGKHAIPEECGVCMCQSWGEGGVGARRAKNIYLNFEILTHGIPDGYVATKHK